MRARRARTPRPVRAGARSAPGPVAVAAAGLGPDAGAVVPGGVSLTTRSSAMLLNPSGDNDDESRRSQVGRRSPPANGLDGVQHREGYVAQGLAPRQETQLHH